MIIYLFLLRRLRIWDYILSASDAPDREIVHSHDFNRYLTPFRAEWDPKDAAERTVIIGRYLTYAPFLFVLHFAHFSHCMPANLDTAACRMMRAYACVAAAVRNSHKYRASRIFTERWLRSSIYPDHLHSRLNGECVAVWR
jgi:hypothetical protein